MGKQGVKSFSGAVFTALLLSIFGCGENSDGTSVRLIRNSPGLPTEPDALNLWLLTNIADNGSKSYQAIAELQNNLSSGLKWSDRFGSRFFVHFDDPQNTSLTLDLNENRFITLSPDIASDQTANFSDLHHQAFWISDTQDKQARMGSVVPPKTPKAVTDFSRFFSPIAERRTYKCIFPGLSDEISWTGGEFNPLKSILFIFQGAENQSPHQFSVTDTGNWNVSQSLFTVDEFFAPDLRLQLESNTSSSETRVSRMILRQETSQSVVIQTNPPALLPIRAYVIERANWNLVYRGGCEL